jgi:hypothetical protein
MGGELRKSHEYSGRELSVENSFLSRRRKDEEVMRPTERNDTRRENRMESLARAIVKLPLVVQFSSKDSEKAPLLIIAVLQK